MTKGTSTVTRRGIHIGSIFIIVGGMVLLTFALLGGWTQAQGGGILYVAPGGDCLESNPCFGHPQAAVDMASSGDVIKVAAGTYSEVSTRAGNTQVLYLGKSVTIQGGYTPIDWDDANPTSNLTTLDAKGEGRVLYVMGDTGPIVEGLRITGGDAAGLGGGPLGWDAGGGIYIVNASATIRGCQIYSNTAAYGGGLYLSHSATTLTRSTLLSNTASDVGGGLFLSYSDATLSNNVLAGSKADRLGSGLYIEWSSPSLLHTTIVRNTGNDSSGVYVGNNTTVALTNTILANHTVGVAVTAGSTAVMEGTLWHGNEQDTNGAGTILTGTVNVIGDPAFIAPDAGNYHIGIDSNARDAGVNTSIIHDLDSELRPACGAYDIGADEWMPSPPTASFISSSPDWMGQKTVFTNTTVVTGCVSYSWDFGDGDMTTTINPIHSYTLPGVYTVALTAANDTRIDTLTDTVTVYSAPTASFTGYPTDGTRPLTVTFISTAATTPLGDPTPIYLWDFGDGETSTLVSPTHIYPTAGVYSVALAVENAAGRHTLTRTGYISVNPVSVQADFTAWPTRGAVPMTVDFTNTSTGDYVTSLWDFGDGSTSTDQNPSHTYPLSGTYPVSLTVSGPGGTDTRFRDDVITTYHTCHVRLNDDTTEYLSVQAAVDASTSSSDIVKVAGICTTVSSRQNVTQVVFISKTLTLRGGYTTTNWTQSDPVINPTILDAQGKGRVLYITGSSNNTMIEGLNITGGDAQGLGGGPLRRSVGGGIYVIEASIVITNNQIHSNRADSGGGVYLEISDSRLNGNTISSNAADYFGGGVCLYQSDATLRSNTISANTTTNDGGGLYLIQSDARLSDNQVSSNTANNDGGGLHLKSSDATLHGDRVYSNSAGRYGGGLRLDRSDAAFNGNTISSNTAGSDGGGLFLNRSDASFTNNLIAENRASGVGDGLYIRSASPDLLHTTIARNDRGGEGLYVTNSLLSYSTVEMVNTILVSHKVGITVTSGNTATMEATLWGTGSWANTTDWGATGTILTGTNNYWGDPAFVEPDIGDYHIHQKSMATDRGVDVGVGMDIDGDLRPMGLGFDIGADEGPPMVVIGEVYLPAIFRHYSP